MSRFRAIVALVACVIVTSAAVTAPTVASATTARGGSPDPDKPACKVIARNSTNDTMRRLDYSKGRGDAWSREPEISMGTGGTGWESVDNDGRICSNSVQYRFLDRTTQCNYAEGCVFTIKVSLTGRDAGNHPNSSCDVNNPFISCTRVEEMVDGGQLRVVFRLCRNGLACTF